MLPRTFFFTHRGANALETNYQSGVSSYIYLGHWSAHKHFYCLLCFFSILPSVCLSILSTLFASVTPVFSIFLSLVFFLLHPILLRQEFYRLCSVSDPMKNCQRQGGEKGALCCIKIRQKQRCGFVSGKFYSRKMVSAVLQWSQWFSSNPKGCIDYDLQLVSLTTQLTTEKVWHKQNSKWIQSKAHHKAFPNLMLHYIVLRTWK